jgi:cyclase
MHRQRVMPCLLLKNGGLVKTVRFKDPRYVGDPINAVRIFNEREVDELVVLDIMATREGRGPDTNRIRDLASECFMPFAYGGGIRSLNQIEEILRIGAEKVCLNSAVTTTPNLVTEAAKQFGSQSIVVSLDFRRTLWRGYDVLTHGGTRSARISPVACATRAEQLGAGEILLNSVDRDGTMQGYDLDLVRSVVDAVSIPVVACGGAGSLQDVASVIRQAGASAACAASLFVFHGKHRAVLINFPRQQELEAILT